MRTHGCELPLNPALSEIKGVDAIPENCATNKSGKKIGRPRGSYKTSVHLPVQCIMCAKSFGKNNQLESHMRIHTGEKPFHCGFCKSSYRINFQRMRHERVHLNIRPFACKTCDKTFTIKRSLHVHMRTHRKNEEKPYKCKYCERRFFVPSQLIIHERIHESKRPFNCRLCDKNFARKGDKKKHEYTVHEEEMIRLGYMTLADIPEKPKVSSRKMFGSYQCRFCGKHYTWMASLVNHERGHLGQARHPCKVCTKQFHRRDALEEHMERNHSSEPFVCEICGKAFPRLRNLAQHERHHKARGLELKFTGRQKTK